MKRDARETAQRYGSVIASGLVGDWRDSLGFEDDDISYWCVGWVGGREQLVKAESDLRKQMANVFEEDACRVAAEQRQREEALRAVQNQTAVDAWVKKKDAQVAARRQVHEVREMEAKAHQVARDCDAHDDYKVWSRSYDALLAAATADATRQEDVVSQSLERDELERACRNKQAYDEWLRERGHGDSSDTDE